MENPLLSLMIFLLKPGWVPKPWSSVAEGKDASCLPENPAYFGGKNGGTIVVTIGFNTRSWSNNLDVRYRDLHFGSFWSMAKGRGGKGFGNLEIRETSSNVHILKKKRLFGASWGDLYKKCQHQSFLHVFLMLTHQDWDALKIFKVTSRLHQFMLR